MSIELSPRATEIANHTKQLLAAGGYHGFSYADLSERVHIGKASIHHHFPSKADLVLTVVALHREQTREGLASLDRQVPDPQARLMAYTGYWAGCIRDGALPICICAMLAAELPMIPPEIAHEVRRHFDELAAWIASVLEDGVAKGQFTLGASAHVEAQAFMSTVHGAMLTARALGSTEAGDAFEAISGAAIGRLCVRQ